MAHKSALDKAREQAQAQISNEEKHKHSVEAQKQEEKKTQAELILEKKEAIKAERKHRLEELSKKLAELHDKHIKERIKADLLYADKESLHVTIVWSLVIMLIVYLLI